MNLILRQLLLLVLLGTMAPSWVFAFDELKGKNFIGQKGNPFSKSPSALPFGVGFITDRTESKSGDCTDCESAKNTSELKKVVDMSPEIKLQTFASNSPLLARIAKQANKIWQTESQGLCWHSVKDILNKAGFSSADLTSRPARVAVKDLKNSGFINLIEPEGLMSKMKDPCKAPDGAVLVYKGGHSRHCGKIPCGHVEVKITDKKENQKFVSDFRGNGPITGDCHSKGNDYVLIGIMVPPMNQSTTKAIVASEVASEVESEDEPKPIKHRHRKFAARMAHNTSQD